MKLCKFLTRDNRILYDPKQNTFSLNGEIDLPIYEAEKLEIEDIVQQCEIAGLDIYETLNAVSIIPQRRIKELNLRM